MTTVARSRVAAPFVDHAENALLLAAARYPQRGEFAPDIASALHWAYVLRAADRQGLTPLLGEWLDRRPEIAIPEAARTNLHSASWVTHFRNRALLHELALVLRAAAARSVLVMPLKGALLAPCYYPTLALRPLSDLDLLVRPVDFETLACILRELGYHELPGPPYLLDERLRDPLRRERAFAVERQGLTLLIEYRTEPLDPMVWQLTDLDPALTAGLRQHAERSWARAREEVLAGTDGAPFVRPSAEDLLLHLASHLTVRHADFRLLWLHDICRVTATHPALDWDYVAREARALSLAGPVFAALQAARRWLGAPLPLQQVHGALFGATWHPRPVLETVERGLLLRRLRALGESDLAAPPPGEIARQVGSLVRLRGVTPRLRALRWVIAPGRTYAAGWRGEQSSAGYAATLALRLVVLALQGITAASRRLALPRLTTFTERAVTWVARRAHLDPFACYATPDDGTASAPTGRRA